MAKTGVVRFEKIALPLVVGFLFLFFAVSTYAGGLDWGGGGGDDEASCPVDDPLVIIPGPLGSPVRLARFDEQTSLVADYSRKTLSWFDSAGVLTPFIETLGKPLSIAIDANFKKNGKFTNAYYFVGNDSARTIDTYYQDKNNPLLLLGQHRVEENGIQALDMVFVQELNLLFVVDGLSKEIKVLNTDGQLVRSFGLGNLMNPKGVAVDASSDAVYISDYGDQVTGDTSGSNLGFSSSIKIFDLEGSPVGMISGENIFSRPQGLALANGNLYLADSMHSQIFEFDRATGVKTAAFGCKGSSADHLLLPMDVILDAAGKNLYVADNRNARVTVLTLTQPY